MMKTLPLLNVMVSVLILPFIFHFPRALWFLVLDYQPIKTILAPQSLTMSNNHSSIQSGKNDRFRSHRPRTSTVIGPDPDGGHYSFTLEVPPKTNGRRDRSNYRRAVKMWCAYHDSIKEHPMLQKKFLPKEARDMALYGQLTDYTKANADALKVEDLMKDDGVETLLNAIDKESDLSRNLRKTAVIGKLIELKRGPNEEIGRFGDRHRATLAEVRIEMGPDFLTEDLEGFLAVHLLKQAGFQPAEERKFLTTALNQRINNYGSQFITVDGVITRFTLLDSTTKGDKVAFTAMTAEPGSAPRNIADRKKKSKCRAFGRKRHWKEDSECPKSSKDMQQKYVNIKNEKLTFIVAACARRFAK